MTYDELYEKASELDGECKVCLVAARAEPDFGFEEFEDDIDFDGIPMIEVIGSGDQPPAGTVKWDYFFTDEPYFDFEGYSISGAPCD